MRPATALACLLLAVTAEGVGAQRFVVTDSMVRQGGFEAIARTRDTIVSSYPRAARDVRFRFSIDGLENEFPGGTEHTIYLRPHDGRLVTALYTFGVEDAPAPPTPDASTSSEDGIARVTFRVDLRPVLRQLQEAGSYRPPLGAVIAGGAHHVYVLGDPAPLTWEYAELHPGSPLELFDPNGDGIYEGTVEMPTAYARPQRVDGRAVWARQLDLSAYPALASSQPLQDAVYRLSLEELQQLRREDGALSAGAKWPGVWTRDVSLAAILSLAIVAPDAARRSLRAKVDASGRIIQDTGTGGSWPVSSDRMVWALAAWEVYAATGDRQWLRESFDVVRRSAEADLHAVRVPATGLFDGESSFMDWREQSYPRWMQPADIYQSTNLGTNVIHVGAYRVLARMARALGEPDARWDRIAAQAARALDDALWNPRTGWYGQYRYGRNYPTLSPRSDALGEALAILYRAGSLRHLDALARRAPVTAYGVPTFWPFIPGERFYHNATVWPFVTAFWTWAAADAGNTAAVTRGLDDATRSTALFLTNKENLVASTGHYDGTALNSDRQLWSVAGTLAGTYRVLFGMRLTEHGLQLQPMVPPSYAGTRMLSGVHYRGAILDVTVRGYGEGIASARLDGRPMRTGVMVRDTLTGRHRVEIVLNERWHPSNVNEVPSLFTPATPRAVLADGRLRWAPIVGATQYVVYRDGASLERTRDTSTLAPVGTNLREYQVMAVDATDAGSFLSEPVRVVPPGAELAAQPSAATLSRDEAGYTGAGYLRSTRDDCRPVIFRLATNGAAALWALDVRYANGNGPVNTEDKAAVRTLLVDGDTAGVVVMPQRGAGRWSEWGWSSAVRLRLPPGPHAFALVFTPRDENMNGRENTALVDQLRLTRLTPPGPPASRRRLSELPSAP